MENHFDGSRPDGVGPRRLNLATSANGYRRDGRAGFQRHDKHPLLKRAQAAVPASGPLGKGDERAPLFEKAGPVLQTLMRPGRAGSFNRYESDQLHEQRQDRDPHHFLLDDCPAVSRYHVHQNGSVKIPLMVGHEDVVVT